MAMQYDVLASAPVTADGALENQVGDVLGRLRIKTVYGVLDQSGTVNFYDGSTSSDPLILAIPVPDATVQGTFWFPMPGEGILAENGVYVELGGADSAVVIYG